jgi:DNA-binding NtrC family response regulator
MNANTSYKIAILEKEAFHRDHLRSLVTRLHHIPFCFERENIFLDNLDPLQPDLAIIRAEDDASSECIACLAADDTGKLPIILLSRNDRGHQFEGLFPNCQFYLCTYPAALTELEKVLQKIMNQVQKDTKGSSHQILVGKSPSISKIKKMIGNLSRTQEPILITGGRGTGKETIARCIHNLTERRERPIIKLDCSLLTKNIQEIGSVGEKSCEHLVPYDTVEGMLKFYNGGTILLNRIDKLPLEVQAELLIIVDQESANFFKPEGSESSNLRIIATTNRDLSDLVEQGKFRKDLYYRINVVEINIPPLRERREDIPILADFFSFTLSQKLGRICFRLSPECKELLSSYSWPGNVEELKTMVERAVLSGSEINIQTDQRLTVCKPIKRSVIDGANSLDRFLDIKEFKAYLRNRKSLSLKEICQEFVSKTERRVMKSALDQTNWNRRKAAAMLEISYKSLLNKIKRYELA